MSEMQLKNLFNKLIYSIIPLSIFSLSPINAALVDLEDTEELIEIVLEGASRTMGKYADAKPVQWDWCEDTYYDSSQNLICLEKKFMTELSEIGEAAVAFVVAHEYAHHVQYAQYQLISKALNNTMRIELQADCFAGIILASIPSISFGPDDVEAMLKTAFMVGDQEYDSEYHHGPGENRALALRSGLRFGGSKGKNKDAYYKMFCLGE